LNLYGSNVKEAHVNGEYVVISYTNDNMEIVDQNFTAPKSVYVKDLTFHVDHIFNYLRFTNRKINKIWSGKDKLYVDFCNIGICNGWDQDEWNVPIWGCFGDTRVNICK
jgi:hypothetical protein